jgi:hypothetical protein
MIIFKLGLDFQFGIGSFIKQTKFEQKIQAHINLGSARLI